MAVQDSDEKLWLSVSEKLEQDEALDRAFYATGVLLAEDDFNAEQRYHRGRLARALAYLHGTGTVAGLEVEYQPKTPAAGGNPAKDEMISIKPGLAIDRVGRLVELRTERCLRLERWYESQKPDQLVSARHAGFTIKSYDKTTCAVTEVTQDGVVVDVFLNFEACERGKTPAFAQGPFDALNAVQPNRLRDGADVNMVLRKEATPPLPKDLWPDLESIADPVARKCSLQQVIFSAWDHNSNEDPQNPQPPGEHVKGTDATAIFLARILIPAAPPPANGERPTRLFPPASSAVIIDNHSRLFAYTARALAKRIGL
ncbi:MAG: hypothetical protein KF716_07330 [Anaerolineae bacterium]|nr:hypothetical protein [Anaerolineae bacterium]